MYPTDNHISADKSTNKNVGHGKQTMLVALLLAVVWLLPFGRLSELPILLMAFGGLWCLIQHHQTIRQQPWFKPFTLVFFAYFLMTAISSLDSYWPEKSWLITASAWRFYLLGVLVLFFSDEKTVPRLIFWLSVIVVVWVLDAGLQNMLGHNLLGLPSYPGRLTGVFGDNVKLGPVLALFLPLLLIQLCQTKVQWRWLLTALVVVAVLLSGTRSAWLMMLFVLLLFWWHHTKGRRWLLLVKACGLMLVTATVLWFSSNAFQQRVERSMALFEGDVSAIDFALADRLPIWHTAIDMYKSHPINGVGARAFRVAYADHAGADDVWLATQGSALHAHHWLLEVLAETGTLGLILMAMLLWALIKYVRPVFRQNQVWPFAVGLLAAMLPVVSLYSLFSSFWSICLWWMLVVLFIGVKHAKD
ncbi:O-antigen ligase family protein [Marinicella sp. S1101]|uniref:O-antigen ligase family protein n=1 Tax=Marinicella marina TaxID=2996016 RepID=UPI002260F10D|nr:O-antigen ligase family protein [Marinicella marina]MCX7554556.1 O-antigen ligase family protein [Marinicella marina]MDJ1141060.1 O-antigen ligase family protein [Marinicella marina]